ncbi:hypothetical protein [uncultured Friedmanniella sp.]|uniref:hypothetical protein n=1 Tax=uncultured Friedmanniella sp. TaxID=335381 RepID=UPI0035CC62F8
MSRPWRLGLAALLVLVALLAVPVALDGATTHYLLPSREGPATSHTAVFGPGVVAAALSAAVALATLAWLLVNLLSRAGRPTRWPWVLVGGLVVLDLVVVAAVGALPHPAF